MLTTHVHLLPRSRMSGFLCLLPLRLHSADRGSITFLFARYLLFLYIGLYISSPEGTLSNKGSWNLLKLRNVQWRDNRSKYCYFVQIKTDNSFPQWARFFFIFPRQTQRSKKIMIKINKYAVFNLWWNLDSHCRLRRLRDFDSKEI